MELNFRILCPLDFSECSLNALEFATRLGEQYGGELILFHVMNTEDYLKLSPKDSDGKFQKLFVQEKLDNLLRTVEDEGIGNGLKSCETQIEEGEIVDSINQFVEKRGIDLVVIGTEGVNGNRSESMGSRASRLVESAETDVLVIPRASYFKTPKKIAYAQDYLEEDKLAIQKVTSLASKFESGVEVFHFESSINPRTESLYLTMREELEPFCKYKKTNFQLIPSEVPLKLAIARFLKTEKIDLLFTLCEEQGFIDQLLNRSLSKKLASSLETPLWVIKSF